MARTLQVSSIPGRIPFLFRRRHSMRVTGAFTSKRMRRTSPEIPSTSSSTAKSRMSPTRGVQLLERGITGRRRVISRSSATIRALETQRHKGHKDTKKAAHLTVLFARPSLCLCALCVFVFLTPDQVLRIPVVIRAEVLLEILTRMPVDQPTSRPGSGVGSRVIDGRFVLQRIEVG